MNEDELRKIITHSLPESVMKRNGQLLYSGIETLCPGEFYFVGFNPAKDGTNPVLRKVQLGRRRWSAYTEQCWKHTNCNSKHCPNTGQAFHQKNVQRIMSELGLTPELTFATNLIFVESRNVSEIKNEIRIDGLFDYCWKVHQRMLAVVKPKYIVCLGNGESDSAFSLVRCKAETIKNVIRAPKESGKRECVAFKSFDGTFASDNTAPFPAKVIGVLHPSRWKCAAGLRDFVYHE